MELGIHLESSMKGGLGIGFPFLLTANYADVVPTLRVRRRILIELCGVFEVTALLIGEGQEEVAFG